jgi:hypothetical protein
VLQKLLEKEDAAAQAQFVQQITNPASGKRK